MREINGGIDMKRTMYCGNRGTECLCFNAACYIEIDMIEPLPGPVVYTDEDGPTEAFERAIHDIWYLLTRLARTIYAYGSDAKHLICNMVATRQFGEICRHITKAFETWIRTCIEEPDEPLIQRAVRSTGARMCSIFRAWLQTCEWLG